MAGVVDLVAEGHHAWYTWHPFYLSSSASSSSSVLLGPSPSWPERTTPCRGAPACVRELSHTRTREAAGTPSIRAPGMRLRRRPRSPSSGPSRPRGCPSGWPTSRPPSSATTTDRAPSWAPYALPASPAVPLRLLNSHPATTATTYGGGGGTKRGGNCRR
jgi:hypothetical protein